MILYCAKCIAAAKLEKSEAIGRNRWREAVTIISEPTLVPIPGRGSALMPMVLAVCSDHIEVQSEERSRLVV